MKPTQPNACASAGLGPSSAFEISQKSPPVTSEVAGPGGRDEELALRAPEVRLRLGGAAPEDQRDAAHRQVERARDGGVRGLVREDRSEEQPGATGPPAGARSTRRRPGVPRELQVEAVRDEQRDPQERGRDVQRDAPDRGDLPASAAHATEPTCGGGKGASHRPRRSLRCCAHEQAREVGGARGPRWRSCSAPDGSCSCGPCGTEVRSASRPPARCRSGPSRRSTPRTRSAASRTSWTRGRTPGASSPRSSSPASPSACSAGSRSVIDPPAETAHGPATYRMRSDCEACGDPTDEWVEVTVDRLLADRPGGVWSVVAVTSPHLRLPVTGRRHRCRRTVAPDRAGPREGSARGGGSAIVQHVAARRAATGIAGEAGITAADASVTVPDPLFKNDSCTAAAGYVFAYTSPTLTVQTGDPLLEPAYIADLSIVPVRFSQA